MRKQLATLAAGLVLISGAGLATATTASAATPGEVCGYNYTSDEPLLVRGSQGKAVQALQCELNLSVRGANLKVDGIFGGDTLKAVVKFQGCAHLETDGKVGPKTWNRLDIQSDIDTSAIYLC